MRTIKLNKEEIIKAIEMGNNYGGSRFMVVGQEGEDRGIVWADNNRQYDPWQFTDHVIKLPAMYPDGSEEEDAEAEAVLKAIGLLGKAKVICEVNGYTFSAVATRLIPEEWQYAQAEKLDRLAETFLSACNDPQYLLLSEFEFEWKI